PPWSVAFLRSRRSNGTTRIEKWTHLPTGRVHFRSRDQGNVLTVFGARPNAAARIADPEDEERTLAWLPELQLDPRGNALFIEYLPETLDGMDALASFEHPDRSRAQRYVKRIRYGNDAPLTRGDALLAGTLPV